MLQAILNKRTQEKNPSDQIAKGICNSRACEGAKVGDIRLLYDGTYVLIVAVLYFDDTKHYPFTTLLLVSELNNQPASCDSEAMPTAHFVSYRTLMPFSFEFANRSKLKLGLSGLITLSDEEQSELIHRAVPLLSDGAKNNDNCWYCEKPRNSCFWTTGDHNRRPFLMESKSGPRPTPVGRPSKKGSNSENKIKVVSVSKPKANVNAAKKVKSSPALSSDFLSGNYDSFTESSYYQGDDDEQTPQEQYHHHTPKHQPSKKSEVQSQPPNTQQLLQEQLLQALVKQSQELQQRSIETPQQDHSQQYHSVRLNEVVDQRFQQQDRLLESTLNEHMSQERQTKGDMVKLFTHAIDTMSATMALQIKQSHPVQVLPPTPSPPPNLQTSDCHMSQKEIEEETSLLISKMEQLDDELVGLEPDSRRAGHVKLQLQSAQKKYDLLMQKYDV